MKTLPLGSFGHHIQSLDDIISTLIGILGDYDSETATLKRNKFSRIKTNHRAEKAELIAGLLRELNRYAPPFTYVGHYPTDDTNWGVWIDLGKLHEAEETNKLVQESHVPVRGRSTYVLLQDMGGLRLYRRKGWVEMWRVN